MTAMESKSLSGPLGPSLRHITLMAQLCILIVFVVHRNHIRNYFLVLLLILFLRLFLYSGKTNKFMSLEKARRPYTGNQSTLM